MAVGRWAKALTLGLTWRVSGGRLGGRGLVRLFDTADDETTRGIAGVALSRWHAGRAVHLIEAVGPPPGSQLELLRETLVEDLEDPAGPESPHG